MRRNKSRGPDLRTQLDEANDYIEELEGKLENISGILNDDEEESEDE